MPTSASDTHAVAIVHDYLTQRGGAERVVASMHRCFPDAPIHTSLFAPDDTFPGLAECDVRTAAIDRVGLLRRHHRLALPVLAPTFSRMTVDAEVTLCSSSGWAHGARTSGRKVVYCYAPARWLYQTDAYVGDGIGRRLALAPLRPSLRRWDRRAARSADRYLAISTRSRDLVRETYEIDAEVLHPPHSFDPDASRDAVAGIDPGFHLCVSRLLPYKNVDAVVAAFAGLPHRRLVVVGRGPEASRLRADASTNVTFVDVVSDAQLRWLYGAAAAVVAASQEDFGLTPVEGAAMGTPAVTLRFGGYLDTVVEGTTGAFFDEATPAGIADAIRRLDGQQPDDQVLRAHAQRFSEPRFHERLREIVAEER